MRILPSLALALLALAVTPALSAAAGVDYPDGTWSQATITETDGTQLHADVLRPKGATDADKTPAIVSIGPYFNHSGQTGPAGPAENAAYDPVGPSAGPSERFADFVEGSKLLQKGYSFVMVDLRGFGGSTGCLDWGGPGEQSDVAAAIGWAASQKWSTGAVGMYGKSYDAMTGLIGVGLRPAALKAVVAQEPVYDDYRYLYGDGMRRENSLATPALYDAIDLTPGPLADTPNDPTYNVSGANDTARPGCVAANLADQQDDDHASAYWKQRDLITKAQGSNVPLFLTQGLTENNTVPDGTAQFLAAHTGPERAWLGPWEHVRGNETCADGDASTGCDATNVGRLKMGRAGWYDETMRFYDQYLKGIAPTVADPPIAVQDNDGTWRAEQSWPPADATDYTSPLTSGSYQDNAQSYPTGASDDSSTQTGVWTLSPPLTSDAHLAGSGTAVVKVTTTLPRANLVVDVYDLDKDGVGPLVSRQGHLIYGTGPQDVTLHLWSADWRFAAGHHIGVRVTDNNQDWWILAAPTLQDVTVDGGSITLPFLKYARTQTIAGDPGVQLASYLADTVTQPAGTTASPGFVLPPAPTTPKVVVKKQKKTKRARHTKKHR